jgi:16S rRNA (uracil1498-N3)-methyltransferase
MPPRLHSPVPLAAGHRALDDDAARHVRVLRLDAGAALTLFDGRGGEWRAQVQRTRADSVTIEIIEHVPIERELSLAVHLAVGMPANDRMDFLVEKATELGAASIQPLVTERSVLRLTGERAAKKQAHWKAVATSACEQCGRNRVPAIGLPIALAQWLTHIDESHPGAARWLLAVPTANGADETLPAPEPARADPGMRTLVVLSGPEGGLSGDEQRACMTQHGFAPRSLGPRVLRAETAPLVALARLG